MKSSARNLRIDNAKGILIILVVIGHFLLPDTSTRFTTNTLYLIYTFHMPCFIFLSGYLAKGVYPQKGTFRWDRLFKLLWLYFLFKIGVHITEGLLEGSIGMKINFFHESGAPWYLLALAIWYLFIPLFYPPNSRPSRKWVAMAVVLFVGLAGGYAGKLRDFLSMDRVLAFTPFFYAGCYFSERTMEQLGSGRWRTILLVSALFSASVVFFGTYDFFEKYRRAVYGAMYYRFAPELYPFCWLIRLVVYLLAASLSFGLLAAMPNRRLPLLTTLGERTLSVYVLHRLIRDLFQYFGFYDVYNVHSKLQVLALMAGCVVLAAVLASKPVCLAFEWLTELPFALAARLHPEKF